jgi:hypothetical protein
MMNRRAKWMIASGLAAAGLLGAGGAGLAAATDDDAPLTGETRDKAVAAALDHNGGGTVTETELGDDGAAYGVEVRRPDGSQVEVSLDESYRVTGTEADDDGPEAGNDGPDDD